MAAALEIAGVFMLTQTPLAVMLEAKRRSAEANARSAWAAWSAMGLTVSMALANASVCAVRPRRTAEACANGVACKALIVGRIGNAPGKTPRAQASLRMVN